MDRTIIIIGWDELATQLEEKIIEHEDIIKQNEEAILALEEKLWQVHRLKEDYDARNTRKET